MQGRVISLKPLIVEHSKYYLIGTGVLAVRIDKIVNEISMLHIVAQQLRDRGDNVKALLHVTDALVEYHGMAARQTAR